MGLIASSPSPPAGRLRVALAAAALLGQVTGTAGGAPVPAPVPEIRFGVTDPPVVAQRDITVRAPTSNHPIDPTPRPLECSGMAWVGGGLLVSSDRHAHALFSVDVDPGRAVIGTPEPRVVIRNEKNLLRDAEAVTARTRPGGATSVYVVTSLSHDPAGEPDVNRRRWARLPVDDAGRPVAAGVRLLDAEPLREAIAAHFDALGVAHYAAYTPDEDRNTDRWGNVEGIAFAPTGDTALLGLRNPRAQGDALVVAVAGLDDAFDTGDATRARVTDLVRLDLGGRGVSDLCWDPQTRGYLLSAGRSGGPRRADDPAYPPANLDYALFWWSGRRAEAPVLFARVADTNIDAVCRVGGSPLIALGSDEGDVSENRAGRQSLLTLMYFAGPAEATP